ncbi:MAG: anion permease, partial [Deltaproteobacteria bacterium]|nr:anion permease [Deltaproteobacteria bacterium]
MAHHGAFETRSEPAGFWASKPGYKPVLLLVALVIFSALVIAPPPQGMLDLVSKENPAGYKLSSDTRNIADAINKRLRPEAFQEAKQRPNAAEQGEKRHSGEEEVHEKAKPLMSADQVARLAKATLLIFGLVVFLWGTEALPLGATDVLVAVMLYLFGVLPIQDISKAYMQDAVFFIFGILAVAVGVAKTGLDKRIG